MSYNRNAGRRGGRRKKACYFCVNKMDHVDFKNVDLVKKFIKDDAKIMARRQTGTCAKHQRKLTQAIKRSRQVALIPFVAQES